MTSDEDLRLLTDLHERGVLTAGELAAAQARVAGTPARAKSQAEAAMRAKTLRVLTRLKARGVLPPEVFDAVKERLLSVNADGSPREPTPEEAELLAEAEASGRRWFLLLKWVLFPGWVAAMLSVTGSAVVPRSQYLAWFLCGGDTSPLAQASRSTPYSGTTLTSSNMACVHPDGTVEVLHQGLVIGTLFLEYLLLTWLLLGLRELRKRHRRPAGDVSY